MGWLFKPGSTRRGMISERVQSWERTTQTLVPVVASEELREGVRQYHARQNEKRQAKKLLKTSR